MDFQKIAIKIAYWLIALSIVIVIAFTFFGRRLIQLESKKAITVKEAFDTETKIKFSDMSITLDDSITNKASSKAEETADKPESEKAAQNR